MMEKFYTPQEIATLLKVDRRSVYRWIKCGRLQAYKVGGELWRISESQLNDFIKETDKYNR